MADNNLSTHKCSGVTRRSFLADTGMGIIYLTNTNSLFASCEEVIHVRANRI
jgi:hypothetical protein